MWHAVPLSQITLFFSGWRLLEMLLAYSEVATSPLLSFDFCLFISVLLSSLVVVVMILLLGAMPSPRIFVSRNCLRICSSHLLDSIFCFICVTIFESGCQLAIW